MAKSLRLLADAWIQGGRRYKPRRVLLPFYSTRLRAQVVYEKEDLRDKLATIATTVEDFMRMVESHAAKAELSRKQPAQRSGGCWSVVIS